MTPTINDIQKSSGDFLPIEPIKEPTKSEIKSSKIKKSSLTLPIKKKKSKEPKLKTDKKSNFFSKFFRHSERKSKIPVHDLPSIERDLSPNNQLLTSHHHNNDPFHIPSTDLPKLNLPLPTYDRPEVNITTGSIQQSSEFSIPIIDLPQIPNLELPESNKPLIDFNSEFMKIPNVELPDLEFTLNNQENIKLPEIHLKTKTEQIPIQPTGLSSSVDETSNIQTDQKNFPIDAIKPEPIISTLTTEIIEITSQTPEQQITIIETHLVQSSEIPITIEVDFK